MIKYSFQKPPRSSLLWSKQEKYVKQYTPRVKTAIQITNRIFSLFYAINDCSSIEISKDRLHFYLRLDASKIQYEEGFSRDVSNIGHWGTGDVELSIKNNEDLMKAQSFISLAYNEN